MVGASPGSLGTAVTQSRPRGGLCSCDSPPMNNVEADIQFMPGLITAKGEVTDAGTEQFLRNDLNELHMFIACVLTVLPKSV